MVDLQWRRVSNLLSQAGLALRHGRQVQPLELVGGQSDMGRDCGKTLGITLCLAILAGVASHVVPCQVKLQGKRREEGNIQELGE